MAVDISGINTTPLSDSKLSDKKPSGNGPTSSIGELNNANNTGLVKNDPSSTAIDSSPASADTVTITKKAETLQMLESDINGQPDVDNERIESLKSAIDSGQYDIDPYRVAEKLIQFETQFVA
jgi:negative regulator of flagellin synthesis FlgM